MDIAVSDIGLAWLDLHHVCTNLHKSGYVVLEQSSASRGVDTVARPPVVVKKMFVWSVLFFPSSFLFLYPRPARPSFLNFVCDEQSAGYVCLFYMISSVLALIAMLLLKEQLGTSSRSVHELKKREE